MVESNTIMIALIVYDIFNRFAHSCVYLSASAFHYQMADPDIGGIYMTLLNSGKFAEMTRKNKSRQRDSNPRRPRPVFKTFKTLV